MFAEAKLDRDIFSKLDGIEQLVVGHLKHAVTLGHHAQLGCVRGLLNPNMRHTGVLQVEGSGRRVHGARIN